MKSFIDAVLPGGVARSSGCRCLALVCVAAVLAVAVPATGEAQTTFTWNGGGADNNWTTADNWGGTVPVADDLLVFSGVTQQSTNNNFTADTSFDSLTLSQAGFTLAGNALQLSAAGTKVSSTGDNTISLGLTPATGAGAMSLESTSGTLTVSGNIGGSSGLTKTGLGTVFLSGSNGYSGVTTLSGGTLRLGSDNAIRTANTTLVSFTENSTLDLNGFNATINNSTLPTGSQILLGGATLQLGLSDAATYTYAGVISGTGTVIKAGTTTLIVSAAQTYTGTTQLVNNNIRAGIANALPISTVLEFTDSGNNRRFQMQGRNQTLAGVDDTAATGGVLIVESSSDNISNAPATLTLNVATGQSYNFGGLVRNAAGQGTTNSALTVVKDGAGTQIFSGNGVNNTGPTYTGTTTINAGILELSGSGGAAASTANGSQIVLNGGSVRFSGAAIAGTTPVRTTAITGTGNVLIGNIIRIGGAGNTFLGDVIIENGGRLRTTAVNTLPSTTVLRFAADGTDRRLQMQGNSQTIAGVDSTLASGGTLIIESAEDNASNLPATLTLDVVAATSYTFSGYVRNASGTATNSALSVTKTGAGTQVFSGQGGFVSYSGPTTISGGILEFSGTNSVANNSAITVNAGGTVRFSGNGTRSNTITGEGDVEKAGANLVTFSGNNDYAGTTTVSAGGLIINGTHSGLGLTTVSGSARIGGTGSLAGGLTIASGGLFVFNPFEPTLDVLGAVTLDSTFSVASLVNLDGTAINWGSVADSTYSLIGLTPSTFGNITNFGPSEAFPIEPGRTAYFTNTSENGGLSLVVVPEPSTFALLGGVAAVSIFMMRRRRTAG